MFYATARGHGLMMYARSGLAVMSLFGCLAGMFSRPTAAQSERRSFEVASVKTTEQARVVSITPRRSGDRISYVTSFQMALCYAYNLQPFQVAGAELPGTFDIEATMSGSPDEKQVREMFQSLLADRFRLVVHRQARDMDVYILVTADKGVILKPSDKSEPSTDPGGSTGRVDLYMEKSGPRLVGKGASMTQLAAGLARVMRGPVLDRTEIVGMFDFDLECASVEPQENRGSPQDLAWSVSTAITRLGLRLKSGKGPVEVLVVDHVERPSAN